MILVLRKYRKRQKGCVSGVMGQIINLNELLGVQRKM